MAQAIYRKYRPKNFSEVLGQNHVVNLLSAAAQSGRFSHAYLFSGPRGTGKTSVARIFSNEIGCHEYDRLEMDAASSRGIDEIRALRDAVYTLPLKGKYKVYIIDEVHMLTREAFNALLKTLEEPPSHVVFILATTEPEKLPNTVVSRCQHFAFKKITEDLLREGIKFIAKKEGFEIDDETAALIALFADGSFRDSQVMLDQIFSFGEKKISVEKARELLSAPSKEMIRDFTIAVLDGEISKGLDIVRQFMEKGITPQLFLKFILRNIRALLMLKLSPESGELLEKVLGGDMVDFLEKHKDKISVKNLGFILLLFLDAYDKAGRTYLPQLPLELALAKIHLRNIGESAVGSFSV